MPAQAVVITDDLAIDGPGADKLTVSGNNTSRVLQVESGDTVRLSGLPSSRIEAILNSSRLD